MGFDVGSGDNDWMTNWINDLGCWPNASKDGKTACKVFIKALLGVAEISPLTNVKKRHTSNTF